MSSSDASRGASYGAVAPSQDEIASLRTHGLHMGVDGQLKRGSRPPSPRSESSLVFEDVGHTQEELIGRPSGTELFVGEPEFNMFTKGRVGILACYFGIGLITKMLAIPTVMYLIHILDASPTEQSAVLASTSARAQVRAGEAGDQPALVFQGSVWILVGLYTVPRQS